MKKLQFYFLQVCPQFKDTNYLDNSMKYYFF